MSFSEFLLSEDRAEDAKKSLDKVKARQKVLDAHEKKTGKKLDITKTCLLYTSPSPRDATLSRMPSSA